MYLLPGRRSAFVEVVIRGPNAYHFAVALDDAAVHAIAPHVEQDEPGSAAPPTRSKPSTLSPIEADMRLIRTQVQDQSQLLAALHQMVVTHTAQVDATMVQMRDQINGMSVQIEKLTEMTEAVLKHLGVSTP